MKRIALLIFALAAIIMVQAQEKPRKEFRDKMMTEKLNLSEEQKQKAKTLNEEFRKKMTELKKKDDLTVKEWRSQMAELNKKHHEDMRGLLNKEQKEKIEKSRLEKRKMADIDANARMEKMKLRLDLSNDQMERLKRQRTETNEKMKAIQENKALDLQKKREEMKTLMDKRKENLKSILTEEQMKKMQEMKKSTHRKRKVLS